ncbi:MAG: response regulator transcription factor [Actinomycetales bacterium]
MGPASAMRTAGSIAAIASDHGSSQARAAAVLAELAALIPMDAAEVVALDPFDGHPVVLATHGYSPQVLDNLHSQSFFTLIESLGLPESGAAIRMKDLPGDPLDNWAVSDVLLPAGYSEGLTMCLRTSDGRFVGMINLSTTDTEHPSDVARDVLAHLCTALGNMADPLRSRGWITSLVGTSATVVGLDGQGQAVAIPGLPGHALLGEGSELLTVAHQSARMRTWSSFVWPAHNEFFRVRVLPCSAEESITSLVSLDTFDIGPLTHRELEVLTLAAEGLSNNEIGEALVVTPRTIATHIEHILDKLQASNRAAAAAFALREGLILGKVDRHDGM